MKIVELKHVFENRLEHAPQVKYEYTKLFGAKQSRVSVVRIVADGEELCFLRRELDHVASDDALDIVVTASGKEFCIIDGLLLRLFRLTKKSSGWRALVLTGMREKETIRAVVAVDEVVEITAIRVKEDDEEERGQ